MTGIAFTQIPAALRLPGAYIEFDASQAGLAQASFKKLIIGQRLAAGTVVAGVPTRITSAAEAEEFFGRGSMLAEMLKIALKQDQWGEMWALALDDNGAGNAATGTLTITGTSTTAGTLNIYIGGQRVQVAIAASANATAVAAAIVAAITADSTLPVTAAAVAGVVTLTSKWKGETGNDIDVRLNYYGEQTPAGVAVAVVSMSNGTANPDVAAAITAMGGEWYNWIAFPYTDATNLTLMETELTDRYSAMQQIGGRAFTAFRGSAAASGTFGAGRNSAHVSCMGTGISPTPPYLWAAAYASRAAEQLAIDPARPLQTLQLIGILPPALQSRWTATERNLALWDGISTFKIMQDGVVRIEVAITMYQVNAASVDDTAYLHVNTPETLERWRYEVRSEIGLRYPRHKLAGDAQPVQPGAAIARPKDIAATMLSVYDRAIANGWMEDAAGYKASLFVEIDASDPNRVNVVDQPNLVNQLRVFANLVQFRV